MTIPFPRLERRSRSGRLALLLGTAALALGPGAAIAQAPTVHLQGTMLGDAAATVALTLQRSTPLGGGGLPAPGQVDTSDTASWLFTAGAGVGVSLAFEDALDDGITATGQLGLMYRTGALVDQVGIIAYGNAKPLGAGPALRALVSSVVELRAGGMWLGDDLGFRWVAGGGVSLQFLVDLLFR